MTIMNINLAENVTGLRRRLLDDRTPGDISYLQSQFLFMNKATLQEDVFKETLVTCNNTMLPQ